MEYRVVLPLDPNYPQKARERLGSTAPTLYYHGNLGLLKRFTMSVLCSDQSHGNELLETNQMLFAIREYDLNYIGSWHSVIETEIFRVGLFKGYSTKIRPSKPLKLGQKTVTLFSAKGLARESYESYLLDRFYPPLHEFPERDEYFRQAEAGELLMLSVCDPEDGRQSRKNIMDRNWMACVLGDVVFIPYGPKGTKTYTTAKKVVEANIPVFTIDHPTSADLHNLGIPGFNRKTVGAFLGARGAEMAAIENSKANSKGSYELPEYKAQAVKEPAQAKLIFKKETC
jgi:hypothetical protein